VGRFRPFVALGCFGLACSIAAEPGRAQSGLFYFVPNSTTVSTFATSVGGTVTLNGTNSGGGSTGGFMSLMRGDQAFAYQTYNGAGPADSVQVINTATQSVVQTLAVTGNPQGMALSPNGSMLYVANNGANTVSAFSVNATTGMLTQTGTISIGAGTAPRVLAVSPDGSTLYTVNQTGNSVSVVNLATNTVTATIPAGTQPASIGLGLCHGPHRRQCLLDERNHNMNRPTG